MYSNRKYWKFFNLYSPSLEALFGTEAKFKMKAGSIEYDFPSISNLYICPLCVQNAIYKDDEFSDFLAAHNIKIEFTDDHYPPESVKGSKKILVCKKCNNEAGAEIDASAKKYLKLQLFLAGNENVTYPMVMKFPWLEGHYGIDGSWKDGGITFLIKKSTQERILNHLKSNPLEEGDQLNFKFTMPHKTSFSKSMLKAAYLKCFSIFGYDFAYSENGNRIRQVIKGDLEHPSPENLGVYLQAPGEPHRDGLYSVILSGRLKYYVVYFTLVLSEENFTVTVFIFIPNHTYDSWIRLAHLPIITKGAILKSDLVEVPDHVTNGNYLAYTERTGTAKKDEL